MADEEECPENNTDTEVESKQSTSQVQLRNKDQNNNNNRSQIDSMFISSSTSKQTKGHEIKMTIEHIDDRPPLLTKQTVGDKRHSSSSDSSRDESDSEEQEKELKALKNKRKTKNKSIEKKAKRLLATLFRRIF